MADAVPDPDDIMEADVHDLIADEPDEPEPLDDFDIDGANGNNEFDFNDRESTPVPEEAVHREPAGIEAVVPATVILVNTPAVDVDAIVQSYKGLPLFERLQFVVDHCPPLRRDALIALINAIRMDSMNCARYSSLHAQLESLEKPAQNHEGSYSEAPLYDNAWVDQTSNRAAGKLDALLSEYKKQKDEGVKESTRRAMEDLLTHYVAIGNYTEALRVFGRGLREFCSQFKHIIQMWLAWLELTICAGEWSRVDPLLVQAERSINDAEEAETALNAATNRGPRPAAHPVVVGTRTNKQLIIGGRAKVDAVNGLSKLQGGKYKLAADKLIKIDVDQLELPWLISSSDLAIYACLTALATHDRLEIKKKVLGDGICRKFLESEPRLVELLTCFVRSRFGRCFDILAELKDRFLLDPFICQHVEPLYKLIRERALIQYLLPFAAAHLQDMAEVFRTTVPRLEDELVWLIDSDQLVARIDSVGGIVRSVSTDPRQETYKQISDACDNMIERVQLTLDRAVIQQGRMSITTNESRNKRKGGQHSDDASDPIAAPNRQKMMTGLLRTLKNTTRGMYNHSEADSSDYNEDPGSRHKEVPLWRGCQAIVIPFYPFCTFYGFPSGVYSILPFLRVRVSNVRVDT